MRHGRFGPRHTLLLYCGVVRRCLPSQSVAHLLPDPQPRQVREPRQVGGSRPLTSSYTSSYLLLHPLTVPRPPPSTAPRQVREPRQVAVLLHPRALTGGGRLLRGVVSIRPLGEL